MDMTYLRYPAGMSSQDVITKITDILFNCPGAFLLKSSGIFWPNYIKRICSHFGVHPAWPIISLQREQSLLGNPNLESLKRACGFVGQDNPGTANKTWDGLPTQLFLCVRNMAWYMGETPDTLFGATPDQWPSGIHRWGLNDAEGSGYPVMLYDTEPPQRRPTSKQEEFCQLTYTPHLKVLETNDNLLKTWVISHF
jgi:hypothetical protein